MKRLLCCVLILALLLCGCEQLGDDLHRRELSASDTTLFAMDTAMNLRLYGDKDGAAAAELTALLQELDRTLDVTADDSTLARLNRTGQSSDETLLALLDAASAITVRTNGAADPTVYPVVLLWGFTGEAYQIPLDFEIEESLSHVGLEHVHRDGDRVTLDEGTALDFGAFAKGWAADRCCERLEARGIPAVLTLGGSIQTVLDKPDGEPWIIGIADPDSPTDYCLTMALRGTNAVVTSGDYQRYFEYNGRRYCHIIDPATGIPVSNGLRSVTVVTESGMTADGLATALFVMGLEEASEFWRNSTDFEAVFLTDEGVYVTEGLTDAVQSDDVTIISR